MLLLLSMVLQEIKLLASQVTYRVLLVQGLTLTIKIFKVVFHRPTIMDLLHLNLKII